MNPTIQERCPECHVKCGRMHRDGCDVEQCPYCGMFATSCACNPRDPNTMTGVRRTDRLRWDGYWPGSREAAGFGWAMHWNKSRGWRTCRADHPKAHPDWPRVRIEATWDPKRKLFVKKTRSQKASMSQQLETAP